jgi:hypothetical protein
MSSTKRYESTTKAESLQIRQADKLAKDRYSFWHDTDPIAVFVRLMFPAIITGILTALIQATGNQPVMVLMTVLIAIASTLYLFWRYPEQWHRTTYLGCIVMGFVFALEIG